jgi:hypothetical protein
MRERVPERRSDPRAVAETVAFLRHQAPLPPLVDDTRLDSAALDHVKLQGPSGEVGHGPAGDLTRRLRKQALWAGLAGETISYGQQSPRDVVRQLIIDADVPDRGHREVLFSDGFLLAGVACGQHAAWGSMCVIDLAGALPQGTEPRRIFASTAPEPVEAQPAPPAAEPVFEPVLAAAGDGLDGLDPVEAVFDEPTSQVANAWWVGVAAIGDFVSDMDRLDHRGGQGSDVGGS